jgi:Antitoxin-like ribbon-helix-helix
MTNKADLSALLSNKAGSTRATKQPPPPTAQTISVRSDPRGRLLGSHVPEEVRAQFRLLVAERNTTMENLHAEALNDLFAKYGKPEICPIKPRTRRQRA